MTSFEESLWQLRKDFVFGSADRLEGMDRLLTALEQTPGDAGTLRELMRAFHAFAGSGRTYGFPEVTRFGLEGETACAARLRESATPSRQDLEAWRGSLEGIRRQLSEGGRAAAAEPPRSAAQGAAPINILVVEDDEALRRRIVCLAEREGMIARSARTKGEALLAIEARLPDGLIVDIVLPDGTGYELVEQVRALPGGDRPAVFVASVRAGFLDKVEAIRCGADAYFQKPVDEEAVVWRLRQMLEQVRARPTRILSVEDDPHQAGFLRALLGSAGYEARVCADPKVFDAELLDFRPDLVLMDVLLPGVSGYDLVRYLRQDERHATLPVVLLTTEGQIEARIEAAKAGADDFLLKPVAPELLLPVVATRIERARIARSLMDRDGLTRLLTHTAFLERARAATDLRARNPGRSYAWTMIDLDRFRSINDRHGHPVGDRVLVSLAALLRKRLRQSDTLGRYAGEEFAILMEDLTEEEAARLVSRLLEEFAAMEHRAADGSAFCVTFSAGVALLQPGAELETWRKAAVDALGAAKKGGRNRVVTASLAQSV